MEIIVLKAAHSLTWMFKPSEQIGLAAIPVLFLFVSIENEPGCHVRTQEIKRPCNDQPHATLTGALHGGPTSVGSYWESRWQNWE